MRLLLDTHVLLWMILSSTNLSPAAKQAILDENNKLFLSAASYWEICVKLGLGKLQLMDEWPQVFEEEIKANRILWLPVERVHCRSLLTLPQIHGDPFDRLLIAQALHEEMTLLTADNFIRQYPVAWIW